MNWMTVLRKILSNPKTANALLVLLATDPSLITMILPANAPITTYAKAHPDAVASFITDEIAIREKYPELIAALEASIPDVHS